MPYSFNPFTSNFDKVEQPPIGFGDVFHLNPLTADQLVVGDGTDFVKILPAGAEGEILQIVAGIPSWQTAPASGVQSVTGTVNRIDISGTAADPIIDISATYAGQNTITTLGTVTTGTWQGTPIDELFGGTGFTTYTEGDLLYSSAANTLAKLAIGAEGEVLTTVSGVPSWQPAAGGGLSWVSETTTSRNSVANEGVFGNNAGTITITLPTGATIGDTFAFNQVGAGLLRIQAQSTDTIRLGNQVTIAAGYVESNTVGDSLELVSDGNGVFRAVSAWGTWDVQTV